MKWYNEAIGYEIYPYSFYDSNGDGYGDLQGIIQKLDYLSDLGVNLLWLCPIYDSPLYDYGYDVSDHFKVNPILGSNDDLKTLISEAHKRGIRIITDFVLNHVSIEHKWFSEAVRSDDNKYHDYFIFRKHPNNWMGFFSESVWTYVPELDEYYFHIFAREMPDLNWENPELRQEIYEIARYYLDMGIDGFRLDAIAHLAKDTTFEDSSYSKGPVLDTTKFSNLPRLFDYLDEFKREVLSKYDCFTIGEVGGEASTEMAIRYADRDTGSINMVFNFDTCWENGAYGSVKKSDEEIKLNLVNMKTLFKKWYDSCNDRCDMPIYWLNHDHPRVVNQYGSLRHHSKSAKMLTTVLMFMYGTPFIYQGEEIGMTNADYDNVDDFCKDVEVRNFIKENSHLSDEVILRFLRRCSRINARLPMQWSSADNAGFTSGEPYLKINGNYKTVNVCDELSDNDSVLKYYKKVISLRKELNELVKKGSFDVMNIDDPDLFVYHKKYCDQEIVVAANFTEKTIEYSIEDGYELLISNCGEFTGKMGPYDAYVFVMT